MGADKSYCMSSFLSFRYIYDATKDFGPNIKHRVYSMPKEEEKILVQNAKGIHEALQKTFNSLKNRKLGILLSGGMDSAILASYMPGCDAYTFRFMGGEYQKDELERAKRFADTYGLKLHYVDVSWEMVERNLDAVMKSKGAPVHSIEPQIYEGALAAKRDGIEVMIIGDGADYAFYGMDGLLSRDWRFEEFYKRMIYVEPSDVLENPTDMHYVFEKYRRGDFIDFLGMYDSIVTEESYASYENAFAAANLPFVDPYEKLKMANPVDLSRIRSGDSKYLIRELFRMRYPDLPVPSKNPMPRPVDMYFASWKGPKRGEFKKDLDMDRFSGNQKWLLWVLEKFLDEYCS